MDHKLTAAIMLVGMVAVPMIGQTSGGNPTQITSKDIPNRAQLLANASYASSGLDALLVDLTGVSPRNEAARSVHEVAPKSGAGDILATTSAGLVLYDDFHANRINPSKWIGEPNSEPGGSDKDRREAVIEVVGEEHGRRLRIATTTYSDTSDNNGAGGNGFGLGFANSNLLKAVSFSLAVNKAQTVVCTGASPDNPTTATAGFFGDYFNPGPPQNGQTGDIVASIGVTNFSANTTTALDVSASISQCQDAKCDGQTVLSFQDLGPVELGSTNTYSAAWDQANHQFIFRLNNNPPVSLTYNMPDSFPPGVPDKSFFVFGLVPHCTSAPRPFASLDTTFGDVYVNR
jgi:hypothetical protein